MEITFLGTSGAVPTRDRNLSALLLEYLGEKFLFDCGEGTQRQMLKGGINFMRINSIFISHLHADHFLGLGGLIQSMNFLDREKDLNIYGPRGMKDMMEHMLSMGTFILNSFTVKVHEIVGEGVVLEGEKYRIFAIKNKHNVNSLSYSFEEKEKRTFLKEKALKLGVPEGRLFSKLQKGEAVEVKGKTISPEKVLSKPIRGRKIVYSGDTRFCEKLVDFANSADVLVHESTFSHEEKDKAHETGHSTERDAATVARKAKVRKLYLTHISQRYPDAKKLEKEAKEIFPESHLARDLMRIKVKKHET